MAVLAVLLPVVMLGFVLALGRYEDVMLRPPSARRTPQPPGSAPVAPRSQSGDVQSGCEH
ncbi:hypothetical protein [Streptomyces meridianus]|uniref:Uncharacterized protein n=1 Tax=Streptomyces meridianus TaxID=2938945 RepID=A0ABT0XCF0_9ACTN|nr:hypothetical protein [Streptomyces meridianus]MCM2580198.1 hypothetical protein [Streptomyces meridianus]